MAALVGKFASLYFDQLAWLEEKILLNDGTCLGSVLDAKHDSKESSKCGGLDCLPPWPHLGIFSCKTCQMVFAVAAFEAQRKRRAAGGWELRTLTPLLQRHCQN